MNNKTRSPDLLLRIGDFMDDIKSLFNPQSALISKANRRAYFGYDAATTSRKDLPFPWDGQAEGMNRATRMTLRARARNLERNSLTTGAILTALTNNIIGAGLNMQSQSDNEVFNNRIEELWNDWVKPENCDYSQQQSLDDMLDMVVQRMFVDGGIIATYPLDMEREIPLTIQLREVDDLATDVTPATGNGNLILSGVEITQEGKPIAYWLHHVAPDGFESGEPDRFLAKDVDFLWRKNRPSQYRELTEMSRSIVPTCDLSDYTNAVAFQQKVAACTAVFIETENQMGNVGRAVNVTDGNESKRVENISAGTIKHLKPGETAKAIIPNGQAAEASTYTATQQRAIAADIGLSLESTSRNVERVNYSSARQNLLADQVTYRKMRKFVIVHFLNPLFKRFVQTCYLAGLLEGTGVDISDKQYFKAVWLASDIGWIDPKKEAEANSIKLSNGGTDFKEYCALQGVDWKERIDSMAEVQAYAKSKGVALSFNVEPSDTGEIGENIDEGVEE